MLTQRGFIRISGEDRVAFLQGLVSNDVARLAPGHAVYAALLTPQGKFLHDFFLIGDNDGILLDSDADRLPDLMQRLKMYRLRSKVSIDSAAGIAVAALWGIEAPSAAGLHVFPDPRVSELGWRAVGDKTVLEAWLATLSLQKTGTEAYERMRIEAGVPEGGRDLIADKSFLLQFGFEDLHGVDFKKGCYVGQEVTARSKHLGQMRKFVYKVQGSAALPAAGTPVYIGDELAGEMRSSAGSAGIALLSVENAEKARLSHADLRSGDATLKVSLPGWIKINPSGA
jgi:tRNA-modifying protein YgfZ